MAKFIVHLKIDGVIETEDEEKPFRLPLDENFGMQLRLARVARGLTLRELGELSGVSASAIGRIERGERTPGVLVVAKLERALGGSSEKEE